MQKHNKKRNTALLVEFIKKSIIDSILKEEENKAKSAYKILRKYFTIPELKKEKKLYDIVINTVMTENIDDSAKLTILEEAYLIYSKLNHNKIEKIKSNLIHEINRLLGPDTFNLKINNYRLYSLVNSIWRTDNKLDRSKYLSVVKEEVKKFKPSEDLSLLKIDEDTKKDKTLLGEFTLRIISNKYNELASQLLPEQQKILKEYIDFVYSGKSEYEFGEHVEENKKDLIKQLIVLKESNESKDVKEKINMVIERLSSKNSCPCKGNIEDSLNYIMQIQKFISNVKEIKQC